MREIKFRVWDNQNVKWANESEARESMGFEFGVHDYFDSIVGEKVLKWNFMQYTGLKDKNEIMIYEGDILKIKLPMGGFWGNVTKEEIGVVKYKSDYGGYIVEWKYSKNQHHKTLTCDIAHEAINLGNRFENPELLK